MRGVLIQSLRLYSQSKFTCITSSFVSHFT